LESQRKHPVRGALQLRSLPVGAVKTPEARDG
jgi:hypothetical protein